MTDFFQMSNKFGNISLSREAIKVRGGFAMKKSLLWAAVLVVTVGYGVRAEMKCAMDKKECDSAKAEMIDTRLKEMTKELGLDADQQAKVKASLEKKWAEKCALKDESMKKMEEISGSADQEIRAALTPEQQTKLDEIAKKGSVCCPKAGKKGHKCPMKKSDACCPLTGGKSKK